MTEKPQTPLTKLIEERLDALETNAFQLADRQGLQRTFVADLLSGRKNTVRGDNILALARALQVEPDVVFEAMTATEAMRKKPRDAAKPGPAKPAAKGRFQWTAAPPRIDSAADMIPVLGTARGSLVSDVRGFRLHSDPIEFVQRPAKLAGAAEVYAIYVEGESMAPKYSSGDLCLIHPGRPPKPGDGVVVQTAHWDDDPGQAYIKLLQRRTGDRLILEQLNPPAVIEIPMQFVRSIHRVLDMRDVV